MYEVAVVDTFFATHAIDGEIPHGHTFRVEVAVGGENLKKGEILIDFRSLRSQLREITTKWEGKNLLEQDIWRIGFPSTEAIAAHIFQEMKVAVEDWGLKLLYVTVWEGDDAKVTYYE
ncbi:MAG: 6-carboxytetrahydropterin synthase [Syntrophales bacterium]|nr:6-carboxytetrahydropterin synthase [Syntrophales bacterium]